MARYHKIKVASYRTKDGRKVGAHHRKVKSNRGTVSRLKELHNHFKGQLSKAGRAGESESRKKKLKGRIRQLRRDINSVKLGARKYRHGKVYRKRQPKKGGL